MDDLDEIMRTAKKKQEQRRTEARRRRDDAYHGRDEHVDNSNDDGSDVSEHSHRSEDGPVDEQPRNIQKVHIELQEINRKLMEESARLKLWEADLHAKEVHLSETEEKLAEYSDSLEDTIKMEVYKRCSELESNYDSKVHQLQEELKKTRSSLKIIKKSNETLRTRTGEDELKIKRYEEKQMSAQSRITNLQRKIELLNQQIAEKEVETNKLVKDKIKSVGKAAVTKQDTSTVSLVMLSEHFALLLQWISDEVLKPTIVEVLLKHRDRTVPGGDNVEQIESTNEQILKLVIFMPNVLTSVGTMNNRLQSSFVQFLYWSFVHIQVTQYPQRLSHSATFRRIGETLFQGKQHAGKDGKGFFRSTDYVVRVLSSLLILHTVTQADIAAQAFNTLSAELKNNELSKETFLDFHGTELLLPIFKLTNKVHLGYVTDILMVLCVDSPYVDRFLQHIGTIDWVQSMMTLLKASHEITLMENVSLLLQRLSKLKHMRAIFDALQVKMNVTELMRQPFCDAEYLLLNLRSVLLNIEAMRPQKPK